ncbi:MAG: hypothetical protein NC091_05530 [Bacteroides sp.]|nr:hypothetical protein [Bacteroides sp.]
MLELNKEYTYSQICEILGWKIFSGGNSKKAQIKEIEDSYEFYHPINKKTHKPKKSYIFTRKCRDMVEPSMANSAGNNRKNIQPMIEYLKYISEPDGCWHSFTEWYCDELELIHKVIANAIYDDDEIDAVCEEENITDDKLFCEYVSLAKAELKNMLLKALEYLQKKDKCSYRNEIQFFYQLGKRTMGYIATDHVNERVKEVETIVCNDMNEEYNLSRKMTGRQLLRVIYNNKKYTAEFKEFCLYALNDDEDILEELNKELAANCETYHPDHGSICSERPIISYYRGITLLDMELVEDNKARQLELGKEITNKIRTKVRRTLRKSYRKFMKKSDLKAIEKALFQFYDEEFDDGFGIDFSEDDMSELDEIFGNDNWGEATSMEHDFSLEEILELM